MYSIKTFNDLAKHIELNINNNKLLNYLEDGLWKSYSSLEFVSNIKKLANGLKAKGVKKGVAVAILVPSSPQWLIMDYALQLLGAISVPIFSNVSSKNLHYELKDADIKFIFLSYKDCSQLNNEFLQNMKFIITLENLNGFISKYDELELLEDIDEDDIATIIYTSGSTGIPKGVELSHKNIITNISDTQKSFKLDSTDVALSFLPLAHIFERMVVSFYLVEGVSIYFVDDVKNVPKYLKEINPTILTVVPRLLEKIDIAMHQKALSNSFFKKTIALLALWFISKEVDKNSLIFKLFDKLVFSKFRLAFGINMRMLVCGGAHLSYKNELFFKNIGMDIYQGYGLTETSPVVCANTPFYKKDKTCGKKYDSVEIKLTKENELVVRGDSVFSSYHNMQKSPIDSALLFLDPIFLKSYASLKNIRSSNFDELIKNKKITKHIAKIVHLVNKDLSHWEKIKRYKIISDIPTIESSILTPSMKISRKYVYEKYSDVIIDFYGEDNEK